METPDNQVVETNVDVQRDALRSIFTPHVRPAVQETAPAPDQVQQPTKQAPVADAPPAVEAVVQDVVDEAKPAEPADPYSGVLDAALGQSAPAPTWTDEAKAVFKNQFGVDDPAVITTQLEQANILKAEYDKVKPVIDQFNNLPPAILNSIKLAMEGKIKEAQEYLTTTPEAVLSNKEASKLSDEALVRAYFPDKVTKEQWEMLNDPEADEEIVDALKTKVGILREAAAEKHTAKLAELNSQQAAEEAARQAAFERYQQATATTVANVKSSPLKGLVDQGTVEEITSGKFLSKFVNPDGSPTPEAATLYLWSVHGQKLVTAAETRGYNRGKMEGSLDATSRQPSQPNAARRTQGDTPQNLTDEDRAKQLVWGALTSK